MNNELLIHKDQTEINDFLLVKNKECLTCEDMENEKCNSMTCEYFNLAITSFSESRCIHKRVRKLNYHEDEITGSLF